ncbi:MAG: hypothetical protein AAGA48_22730 [Myxococcota bacterium]
MELLWIASSGAVAIAGAIVVAMMRQQRVKRHLAQAPVTAFHVEAWTVARPALGTWPGLGQVVAWTALVGLGFPAWTFFALAGLVSLQANGSLTDGDVVLAWGVIAFWMPFAAMLWLLFRRDVRSIYWERLSVGQRGLVLDRVRPLVQPTPTELKTAEAYTVDHEIPWHEVEGVTWDDELAWIETTNGDVAFGPLPKPLAERVEAEIAKRVDTPEEREPDASMNPLIDVVQRSRAVET